MEKLAKPFWRNMLLYIGNIGRSSYFLYFIYFLYFLYFLYFPRTAQCNLLPRVHANQHTHIFETSSF